MNKTETPNTKIELIWRMWTSLLKVLLILGIISITAIVIIFFAMHRDSSFKAKEFEPPQPIERNS